MAGFRICSHCGSGAFQKAGTMHRIFLSLEGRFVFYRQRPAVIQKYGIWAECHLFIKTQKTLGPLVAFLKLSGTAGAQLCTQNSRNWSAAMATGNTESGLANQWLKMHAWKSYFIVNNCFICWHTNASIQITFFCIASVGFYVQLKRSDRRKRSESSPAKYIYCLVY